MNKNLVILLFFDTPQKSEHLINKIKKHNNQHIIAMDLSSKNKISSFNNKIKETITWISTPNFQEVEEEAREHFFSWMDQVREKKINDISIKELFLLNSEISLWWFTGIAQKKPSKTIAYDIFISYQKFLKTIPYLEKEIQGKSYEVNFIGGNHFTRKAFEGAVEKIPSFSKNGILKNKRIFPRKILKTNIKSYFLQSRWVLLIRNLIISGKTAMSFLGSKIIYSEPELIEESKPVLIATTNSIWEFQVDSENIEKINHIYWPNLRQKLLYSNINLIWLVSEMKGDRTIRAKINKQFGSFRATLWPGFKVWFSLFKNLWNLHRSFQKVFAHNFDINKNFYYDSLNLYPLLKNDFRYLIYGKYLEYGFLLKSFENSFNKIKPIGILERKPFNDFGRLVIGASGNFPVFGIQHGIVNNKQIGYLFSTHEISQKKDMVKFCPLPDKMLVFGERMKNRMVKNGYPSDSIKKIGDLKYDNLFQENQSRTEYHYSKKNSKPLTLLLILQYSAQEIKRWSKLVSQGILHSEKEIYLRIKPHPQHNDNLGDLAKNTAIKEGISPDNIDVFLGNIFQAIHDSDLVVLHSSTAGIDALICGKPILLIEEDDLENDNELYKNSNIGFVVSTYQDLSNYIQLFLSNEINWHEWEISRNQFIKFNLENFDGKGWERFLSLIKETKRKNS